MESQDRDEPNPISRGKNPFQRIFAGLPEDPNRRLDALADVNRSFRRALADQLRPVVRTLLQEAPPSDDKGKRELARRLNHVLRDANLAIADPGSGQAASVIADAYRLRLQSRHAAAGAGRQTPSPNIKTLPPLELIEHVRQEPIGTWRARTGRDSEPGQPQR